LERPIIGISSTGGGVFAEFEADDHHERSAEFMNTRRYFLTAGLLILILLAFRPEVFAQNAQLSGIITDENSALIAGARPTLTNVALV
jgi:hypothetical protein